MSSAIPVGPFDLEHTLGKGGMGEVWRGVHRVQQVPVAVKVLTSLRAQDPRFISSFRNEIRAVAGVQHPSIVMVLDYGAIGPEAASHSDARLVEGNPYMVMELVDGGSLSDLCGRMRWPDLRDTLLQLLDALGHAHARQTIHRDIKPGNVLRTPDGGGIKLSDFGVSHVFDMFDQATGPMLVDNAQRLMGTPAYMAPEQVRGDLRGIGPWTDLYALGCTAYALAAGHSPFGGATSRTAEDLLAAHVNEPVPSLHATRGVAPGFESWVRMLLEKNPLHRFRRAADAAWALSQLDEQVADHGHDHALEGEPDQETASTTTADLDFTIPSTSDRLRRASGHPPAFTRPRAPLPSDWGRSDEPMPPMPLQGAGMALYGLRPIPLVDRQSQRDALWRALRMVHAQRRARLVLLEGAAGCGKTRLAQWVCERAHEVGAASVLRVVHGPIRGSGGIAPMVARHLGCQNLSRPLVLDRVMVTLQAEGVHDPGEWHALTELVCPASDEDIAAGARQVRFTQATERHVLIEGVLQRHCRERPVILWIDDIQWGLDSLGFLHHLMKSQRSRPQPVLVLLTAQSEALGERPIESRLLRDKVMHMSRTERIMVGPLPVADQPELISRLLYLDGPLVGQVAKRTAGNPLFAVQLIGDWVQRGILVAGPRGFQLQSGVELDLPADLHEVWQERIDQMLEGRTEDDAIALELAATLGHDVDAQEWAWVCALVRLDVDRHLAESLVHRGLAVNHPEGPEVGWSFSHGMLRESIELRARRLGRLARHHKACAAMLESRPRPGFPARLGRHLLGAGDPDGALEPLLEGAEDRFRTGDNWEASALATEVLSALEGLALADSDPRTGRAWHLASRLARRRGEIEEALTMARRVEDAARSQQQSHLLADVLQLLGSILMDLGNIQEAVDQLDEGLALALALDDREHAARLRVQLLYVLTSAGEMERAEAHGLQALVDARNLDDPALLGLVLHRMGRLCTATGKLDEATVYLDEAAAPVERTGDRYAMATLVNTVGELARAKGDVAQAEAEYRDALQRYRALGSGQIIFPEINLGILLAQRGAYHEAGQMLERVLQRTTTSGLRPMASAARIWLAACAAGLRDWPAFDEHLESVEESLEETGFVDSDIARGAELAAELACDGGERGGAREALEMAVKQWGSLGRTTEAERVKKVLLSLDV